MEDFTFRVRFKLAATCSLDIKASSVQVSFKTDENSFLLSSQGDGKAISQSHDLILESRGWSSSQAAQTAGEKCRDALMVTLAGLRVGADFGNRAPKSFVTDFGVAMLEQQLGERVLNDEHGLMVFDSDPSPRFASVEIGSFVRGVQQNRFEDLFNQVIYCDLNLLDRYRLSLDLFNTSFFENSPDTRFLTLIMAVEALLEPPERSDQAASHVNQLINLTKNSTVLSDKEKDSLLGSLRWLLKESISQTGRDLAYQWLKHKTYMDKEPSAFFTYCYGIRSQLIHGNKKRPSRDEVGSAAATLEVFVSDLLCAMLIQN